MEKAVVEKTMSANSGNSVAACSGATVRAYEKMVREVDSPKRHAE
jgi:hypothetical protein